MPSPLHFAHRERNRSKTSSIVKAASFRPYGLLSQTFHRNSQGITTWGPFFFHSSTPWRTGNHPHFGVDKWEPSEKVCFFPLASLSQYDVLVHFPKVHLYTSQGFPAFSDFSETCFVVKSWEGLLQSLDGCHVGGKIRIFLVLFYPFLVLF